MFDIHDDMARFFEKYVKLGKEEKDKLREYRNLNTERLNSGLEKLEYNAPVRTCGQGSYSMHTMVQHPDNDYDIDVAVIFNKDDLPSSPLNARKRVLAGIEAGVNSDLFNEPPEVRKNAVTVWYAAGYHIDLAVYRCYEDDFGHVVIEHASTEWCRRDPAEMNDWFAEEVESQSPDTELGAIVAPKQMRRIVQLIKMFTKVRSESMPGGLLISALVAERYVSNNERDDIAFYETLKSIRSRLTYNVEIMNPVDSAFLLTDTEERKNEVRHFKEALDKVIDNWLVPLFDVDCDAEVAYKAWNKLFKHEYWSALIDGLRMREFTKFVSSTGTLYTHKPEERSIVSPTHRFYGSDD